MFLYLHFQILSRFLIKSEDGVCTLDIRSAEISDSGDYKCVIQDFGKEGDNETKCRVDIEEFTHKFTGDLKGKKVVEDETAVFELGVEEDDAEVKWYKDGVEIVPDGKRLISCDPYPALCLNLHLKYISLSVDQPYPVYITHPRCMNIYIYIMLNETVF